MDIGGKISTKHTFSERDVQEFARLSGDDNPIHLSDEYAKTTRFGSRIVHGAFVASLFSRIFGTKFPGHGAIYLNQELKFLKPVYLDSEVEAEVEFMEYIDEKQIGIFKTVIYNSLKEEVLIGQAKLKFQWKRN